MSSVHLFPQINIDTDIICPARYLNMMTLEELAPHAMEPFDPNFCKKVQTGDVIVAGKNFGCGSSREHAVWALYGAGIRAVIASSFARIFFRNCINYGLVAIILEDAPKKFSANDKVELDLKNNRIKNLTSKKEYQIEPLPDFVQKIVEAGGLLKFAKKIKM